ncbi:MAG: 4a-hydroxytetrahydrobiopterin dehydratase [Candidatus Vogelbacteria bacterium]|nr:4a-hydroxytetrahydrobiopterin dehydratase [Candidatus Vogelbacteria bacterium]
MNLREKKCRPCEEGTSPLQASEIEILRRELRPEWHLIADNKLRRAFVFKDFRSAIAFVNRLAELAEAEGHHPDLFINYNKVTITLWTHAIAGLSENDFILAAKIDSIS